MDDKKPVDQSEKAANPGCSEGCYWASHHEPGIPFWIRQCMICKRVDYDDLRQVLSAPDGWIEKHYADPKMIVWQDVVAGLKVMGLDVSDKGDSIIKVEIYADHLLIERGRKGLHTSGDPHKNGAIWSVTKDILMKPRRAPVASPTEDGTPSAP